MPAIFVPHESLEWEKLGWGELAWISRPQMGAAEALTTLTALVYPGQGHDFHRHPEQEEVIYVLEGTVEQWLGTEMRRMSAGDSVFIPKDGVHATFNIGSGPARTLAILGPCAGPSGYTVVDVSKEAPWNALRSKG